jgi:hypothetical protein
MSTPWEHLKAARATTAALKAIAREADPASGISFSVRRGVARDNPDYDDSVKRPWVTIEVSTLETACCSINFLLRASKANEDFWAQATKRAIAEAAAILENPEP